MTTRILLPLFSGFLALISNLLPPAAHAATDVGAVEREITHLEQVWNDAYGANDLPKYFGYYAEAPLLVFYNKRTALADYRKEWTTATKTEPVVAAKISDLKIQVGPSEDTAVASYQLDVSTKHADGKVTVEHAFEMDVWFKQKSGWRVGAVHYSVAAAT
jgi:ketosteroid isomerase-like protein